MNYWILKTEPSTYSWQQLEKDKTTAWTGVRNYQARNNLRAMNVGDICLFYHSGEEKKIVGIAKVVKAAYVDTTAPDEDWVCVDIGIEKKLKKPITLQQIKAVKELENIALVRNGRLSVSQLTSKEYKLILMLTGGESF